MTGARAIRRAVFAAAAAAVLAGCQTSSTVGIHLEPGDAAWFDFRGEAPAVQVYNAGPGEVWIEAVSRGLSAGGLRPTAMRTVVLPGGGSISLRNDSTEPADVEFTVEGSTGIGMTKTPARP